MRKLLAICLALLLPLFSPQVLAVSDSCANLSGQDKVNCYTQKVADTQGQERTLSSQIAQINKQIATTELQISQTEQKLGRLETDISSVSGKIDRIEESLSHVSTVLSNRIVATYIV